MAKIIKISPTKAYSVEGVVIQDQPMVSIRQMYATKKDPKFKHGRKGITIGIDELPRVMRAIKATFDEDVSTYTELNVVD